MKRERFTYIHQEGEPLRELRTAAAAHRPDFEVVEAERAPTDAIPYTLTSKAIAHLEAAQAERIVIAARREGWRRFLESLPADTPLDAIHVIAIGGAS